MKKRDTKCVVLLRHHLEAARLPTMHAECAKSAAWCGADYVDHLGVVLQACALELLERERLAGAAPPASGAVSDAQDARLVRLRGGA